MFRSRVRFSLLTFSLLLLAACNQAVPPESAPFATQATIVLSGQASCEAVGGTFISNGCRFYGNGALNVPAGDVLDMRISVFTGYGTFDGDVNIASGVSLETFFNVTNNGTLTVATGGRLANMQGTFTNNGTIKLECGSTFQRQGQQSNDKYVGNEPVVPADCIRPDVTVNQASDQADPTSTSSIRFTVVFSEPVTGFATDDVTLGGTAGATTATVTETAPNDGTTYTVAVSGMTQDGTVTASVKANAAQDAAGNASTTSTSTDNTVTYTAPVVDAAPPLITLSTPVDGASYKLKKPVAAAYSCTDEDSGIATCAGTVPNGSAIDTATVGEKTFTVTSTDNAGNRSEKTVSYKVVYDFKGFFLIKNPPALNKVKAGAVVPFSFTLGGNYGRNVVTSATSVPISCTTLEPLNHAASRESVQSDRSLGTATYSRNPLYVYLWFTSRSYKGMCRQFTLTLNDSTQHQANFKFY